MAALFSCAIVGVQIHPPALTFAPRPGGRTLALDHRMHLAGVGGVTVSQPATPSRVAAG